MRAWGPGISGLLLSDSRIGRANARVLPVPVWAVATTSCPSMAGGIASAWIGVGVTNPCAARFLRRTGEVTKSEKLFIQNFFVCKRQSAEPDGNGGRSGFK